MDQVWNTWIEKDNDLEIAILALDATPNCIQFEVNDVTFTLERTGSDEKKITRLSSYQESQENVK